MRTVRADWGRNLLLATVAFSSAVGCAEDVIDHGDAGDLTPKLTECVTAEPMGRCGPYLSPDITGSNGSNTVVDQDVWNPIPGWSQTLHAKGAADWYVTANMPAGNTAVVSFANSWQQTFPGSSRLTDFASITSSFSESAEEAAAICAGWAYDIWLNDWADEVMIQHDNRNRGSCDDVGVIATATFGGAGGVPAHSWNLCKYRSELIWQLVENGSYIRMPSGSVDVLAMLEWLVDRGHLRAGSMLDNGIAWGVNVCSTGGVDQVFRASRFSITVTR